jgi:hypothetical protein
MITALDCKKLRVPAKLGDSVKRKDTSRFDRVTRGDGTTSVMQTVNMQANVKWNDLLIFHPVSIEAATVEFVPQ